MKRQEQAPTPDPANGARLSIGALSRATAIAVETLRTWERRYGYPVPERKVSGHRVYAVGNVPRLRRIAEALACGHRAGEVVPASDAALSALLRAAPHATAGPALPSHPADADELLAAVQRFDTDALTRPLLAEWARRGPLDFLEHRLAPLIHEIGERWATGALEIRHEHFVAERIGDLLRTVRLPFDERARGPLVVLSTLPGEAHALGLQMAALLLASAGRRVCYVGTEVPHEQIVSLARDLGAAAVGISVSTAGRATAITRRIARLRRDLPPSVEVLVGGGGAPAAGAGIRVFGDLERLHAWATAH